MSNTTTVKGISLYDVQNLSNIILVIDRYMLFILYITGTIGAILNIITFLQKQIRQNSCSVYFLATSIVDFCIMHIFLFLQIIVLFNNQLFDLIFSTNIWCKFGNYIMFIFPCLSSTYIAFASIDRFCISSLNSTIRKLSNVTINRRVVIITFIIWAFFGLHIPIAYNYILNSTTNTKICTVQTNSATVFIIIDGYFFSLFNGGIIPFVLCIVGILIYHNIKTSRRRVAPQQQVNHYLNRQNTHMITMVLVQVLVTIILNIPYIVIYLLSFYQKLPTNPLSLYFIIIFTFIARWFYYMNYCKTFYINTLTSGYFRDSLRRQSIQLLRQFGADFISRSIQLQNTNTR